MRLPYLVSDCCHSCYIDTTEYEIDRQWWGRCNNCKEMSKLTYGFDEEEEGKEGE